MRRAHFFIATAILAFLSVFNFSESLAGPIYPTQVKTPTYFRHVPDKFAAARGLALRASDFDKYIDPRVGGADRELARRLMSYMPPNQRGDFAYISLSGHLVSNNPALLRYIKVEYQPLRRTLDNAGNQHSKSIRPDYSNQCSAEDPGPGGPYVRQVSQCATAAGFAFVNVTCGTTKFFDNDTGYLYMELVGNGGPSSTSYEGGLQYNSDASIAPWATESDIGQIIMNNNNARYKCGNNLVIVSGVTWDGLDTFTEVGVLPNSCNPQAYFCGGQEFTPQNGSWMFYQAPPYFAEYPNIDTAGFSTPCSGCSVSRVTSIAQPLVGKAIGYKADGSYFGISPSAQLSINWMQVAYGEWGTDCVYGTTLCTGYYPADPSWNYGGPQYYPDSTLSQSYVIGVPGYGPYEAWDAINMTGFSKNLKPGPFNEPLPPLPCTLDGKNYCASLSNSTSWTEQCDPDHKAPGNYRYKFEYWYQIFSAHRIVGIASDTQVWSLNRVTCSPLQELSNTWSPQEPKTQYNDPNLP